MYSVFWLGGCLSNPSSWGICFIQGSLFWAAPAGLVKPLITALSQREHFQLAQPGCCRAEPAGLFPHAAG
jgi:hypothetical protein